MVNESNMIKQQLGEIGVVVESIYDLVNISQPYPKAIPVLLSLLENGIENIRLREGVIRALAVKEARGKAGQILLKEFYRTPLNQTFLLWVIGNSMEVVITKDEVNQVLEIVKDKSYGIARQMFVLALGKIKSKKGEVEEALLDLFKDEEVIPHAINALGKLKSTKAKSKIEGLINHNNSLIRKEAKKALKKLSLCD